MPGADLTETDAGISAAPKRGQRELLEEAYGRIRAVLELDATEATVRGCVAAADFRAVTGGRARGEEDTGSHFRKGIVDTGSHFRKGIVGDWRNHFTAETSAIFTREAGDVLDLLGYRR